MADVKKTVAKVEVTKEAEKKAEAPKAVVKKAVAPKAEKAVAPKAEKAVAPKAEKVEAPKAEKKAAAPKAEKAAAPKAEKKAAAPKAAKKDAEVVMTVQFGEKSYTQEQLVASAKDVWQYDLEKKPADLKSIELYVKPEEGKVYVVYNKDITAEFMI